jgi:hypothetical protein
VGCLPDIEKGGWGQIDVSRESGLVEKFGGAHAEEAGACRRGREVEESLWKAVVQVDKEKVCFSALAYNNTNAHFLRVCTYISGLAKLISLALSLSLSSCRPLFPNVVPPSLTRIHMRNLDCISRERKDRFLAALGSCNYTQCVARATYIHTYIHTYKVLQGRTFFLCQSGFLGG